MTHLRIGVLISGTGTNLQAIVDATASKELDATVSLVISNREGALGLERASKAGLPTRVIPHGAYANREAFEIALIEALRAERTEWVVLAGFMRVLTPTFLEAFKRRVINIHPSLLPAFPGVDAQTQALNYGVKIAGCSVHFVDAGVDTGPIIGQAAVCVLDDDSRESLGARMLLAEHRLLVRALRWVAEDRVEWVESPNPGGRPCVRVRGHTAALGFDTRFQNDLGMDDRTDA